MIWNSCEWWLDGRRIRSVAGVFVGVLAPFGVMMLLVCYMMARGAR